VSEVRCKGCTSGSDYVDEKKVASAAGLLLMRTRKTTSEEKRRGELTLYLPKRCCGRCFDWRTTKSLSARAMSEFDEEDRRQAR
jgi:hypothetical protein